MKQDRVIVVGAGAGGLAAAIDLAHRGAEVTVLEAAAEAGGKIRQLRFGDRGVDCGPTVFTMRWIFDELFENAGAALEDYLSLSPATVLARHAWRAGGRLDLYSNVDQSAQAIAEFATAKDADGYRAFCKRCEEIYLTLRDPFISDQRPSHLDVVKRVGLTNMPAFMRKIEPMKTLWGSLERYFEDPRLLQLFGRYATYVGSSPFSTPATIMLVAHVERDGVWTADGGMRAVAGALQRLAEERGAQFQFNANVSSVLVENGAVRGVTLASGETIQSDAVVFNGDISALGGGLLGRSVTRAGRETSRNQRSLSAVTWSMLAKTSGFPLAFHNVFFAEDYKKEFDDIFKRRTTTQAPTVYLCAQDRDEDQPVDGAERLFLLANAPADGDVAPMSNKQIETMKTRILALLSSCGLEIDVDEDQSVLTSPADFHARFPATGGALYGQTSHGMMATLARAGARTNIKGLYVAGGSVHPGPGVPMAAMSGRLAAALYVEDRVAS